MYQKHNSFVGIRHRARLPDVLARIRRVQERARQDELDPRVGPIVRAACDELLESSHAEHEAPFTLQSYVIEEMSRLDDSQLVRYLFYRYRYETFPRRRELDEFPPCLQIEPTSQCNYRCVFCYQTDREFTQKRNGHMGTMSMELFTAVIDQAAGQCEAVTLASRGEPLMCPDIKAMLRYAGGKFLALKMNTNAWFLDEATCHAILQSDMNTLVLSVDATSEDDYRRLRPGGKLERIIRNIGLFQEIRHKHYPKARTITRVAGVKVPGTPDLAEMERFWGHLVDQVAFVTYNPWENVYRRSVNAIGTPCSDLWRRMFVWWDGSVNPCDVDYRSTLCVGKATERPLSELWRSREYMELRSRHAADRRADCHPCNRCVVV